jgi:hypothetical protein
MQPRKASIRVTANRGFDERTHALFIGSILGALEMGVLCPLHAVTGIKA